MTNNTESLIIMRGFTFYLEDQCLLGNKLSFEGFFSYKPPFNSCS